MKIAIIPAKAHSSRLPNKNVLEFFGSPFFQHSVVTAKASELFDAIYVSTESAAIAAMAEAAGATPWMRPEHLCGDECGPQHIAADVLKKVHADYACVIHACAPLVLPLDLKRAFELLYHRFGMAYCFAVGQDPLRDAGAFYWGRRHAWLAHTHIFAEHSIMLPLPDARVCDVNTLEDFERCKELYRGLIREAYAIG